MADVALPYVKDGKGREGQGKLNAIAETG